MNIVLIGMPGAGKSTIGVVLAKTLGMDFMDTDLEIQRRDGRLLQTIISEEGIDGFLQIEEETILALSFENKVVATGGSVVKSPKAMAYLKAVGQVVYLKLDYATIERRVRNIKTRGIAMSSNKTLLDVYNERLPLYETYADRIIDCRDRTVEEILETIAASDG